MNDKLWLTLTELLFVTIFKVLVFPFGRYNLRKGFLAGQKDAIARYVIRGFELLERSIYMKRKTGNKSVTQGVAIVDLQGFNLARMAAGIVSVFANFFN